MKMNKLTSEEIRSLYDDEYVEQLSAHTLLKNKRLLEYINLDRCDVVLDIGCGDGSFAHLIHGKIGKYVGVDFSEKCIQRATAKARMLNIANAEFVCEDIAAYCAKHPKTYDKAFALDFTEHVYDDELVRILGAVKTSLKENGLLYIHTPNGEYLLEILKKRNIAKQFIQHIAVRNRNEMVDLLARSGFMKVESRYISHYNVALRMLHFLSYVPLVGKYFRARIFMVCQ